MNVRIYTDSYTVGQRLRRLAWVICRVALFVPARGALLNPWRIFLLRRFGATFGVGCKVGATCVVWAPWNVIAGDFVCLADGVDCYSADLIRLGNYSTVSQRAYLCAASHDISSLARPLTHAPITIEEHAWVCAEAFVGPGVVVGAGAVIGARCVVTRSVDSWVVVAGNPATKVKDRTISTASV